MRGVHVLAPAPFADFPAATSGLIDDFNRANSSGLGPAFQPDTSGDGPLNITSQQVSSGSPTGVATEYTVAAYPNDCESWIDVPVIDTTANVWIALALRNDGVAQNNVYYARYHTDTGQWEFRKRVGGAGSVQFGTPVTQTIAAGDSIGFRISGTTLTAYRKTGGVWSQVMTATDSSIPGNGANLIGFSINASTTTRLDNFSGSPSNLGVQYLRVLLAAAQTRLLALRRPQSRLAPPAVVAVQSLAEGQTVLLAGRTRGELDRRAPRSRLAPPATLEPQAVQQAERTIRVALARVRPRRTLGLLADPAVVEPYLRAPDRRLRIPALLTRTRPRRTLAVTVEPATLEPQAVELAERTIRVALTRTRPRPTRRQLAPPTTLRVFAGPVESEVAVRIPLEDRRRAPHSRLAAPTVVEASLRPPDRRLEIPVALARVRPRRTVAALFPATVAPPPPTETALSVTLARTRPRPVSSTALAPVTYPATSEIAVTLARTRPRPTRAFLPPPTALQTFQGPQTPRVRVRPRATVHRLAPPTVVRVPSVELGEQTIRVALAHTRPRPTVRRLGPPTALQTFLGPATKLVRARPRPTVRELQPPTVVRVPSVDLAEQTVRVALVRARPRPTTRRLTAPTTLQEFSGPAVSEVAVRIPLEDKRRAPHSRLFPPLVVRVPAVEQAEQTIRVALVRSRPRPTSRVLRAPTVLRAFAGPTVTLARIRPRPTTRTLAEPTVVRVASVDLAEQTIRATLTRTRPRPTISRTINPTVLKVFPGPSVTLARVRPRPTTTTLFPPTKLLVGAVEQQLRTIRVALTKTRPRPTTRALAPPAAVSRPPFFGPTVVLAAVRTRAEMRRRFPLQGWRQRLVRETGSTATFPMFDPLLGPRPPQIIDPLPTLREETIRVSLAAVRTRVEAKRHFPLPGFTGQPIRETGQGAAVIQSAFKPLLGVRPPTIIGPLPTQQQQTIQTTRAAVRTRVEAVRRAPHSLLGEPQAVPQPFAVTELLVALVAGPVRSSLVRRAPSSSLSAVSYPQTGELVVALAGRTRGELSRRAPRSRLSPPAVVRVPSVELGEQTIRVALAGRTRAEASRRAPRSRLSAPVFYPATSAISVTTVAARPRPTRARLAPPTTLAPTVTALRIALATTRPRRTHPLLRPPAVAAYAPLVTRVAVALVRSRPRPTARLLAPPTVVVHPPLVTRIRVALVRRVTRPGRPTLRPPVVVAPTPLPTADQRTIRVALAVQARLGLLRRRPHYLLPQEIVPPPIPGFTSGYTVPGAVADGSTSATAAAEGGTIAPTASEGGPVAVAESTGETVSPFESTGHDERSGL